MIILRPLKLEDAEYMLEFIEDNEIANNFKFTRYPFSIDGFSNFIRKSWSNDSDIHYAIETNEYAGTISLKNFNKIDRTAEYAIVLRKKYWGTGIAKEATAEIINYGFNVLNLEKIYLNVLSSNIRAQKFYEKLGFSLEGTFKRHVFVNGKYEDLNWYCLFRNNQ
jgi:diamine N-acetyltransferase